MDILYVANNRIPTPRAHGIHIVKMCEALAAVGSSVKLIIPRRRNSITENIFSYYGATPSFTITKLPVIDLVGWIPFAFALETLSFGIVLLIYLLLRREPAIVYVRGEPALFLARLMPKRHTLFWETHIKLANLTSRYRPVLRRAEGIVVVTNRYRDDLVALGIPKGRVLVAPDGVDVAAFALTISKEEARAKVGLPNDKKLAVYCGSDLVWKGIQTLKDATHELPDGYKIVFVGAISSAGAAPEKSFFAGERLYRDVPLWLRAADVLVLTGTLRSEVSKHYTSPLKLFEYMASGRPIVASDVSSFRDILTERTALFVEPDNPHALARGIVQAVEEKETSESRASLARVQAPRYSWQARAEHIKKFIEQLL